MLLGCAIENNNQIEPILLFRLEQKLSLGRRTVTNTRSSNIEQRFIPVLNELYPYVKKKYSE